MTWNVPSRPTRARGLKLVVRWQNLRRSNVAPHAGAWIETGGDNAETQRRRGSRPTRARGLKHPPSLSPRYTPQSRPTRARGLKLSHTKQYVRGVSVAPHAGAWIETGGDNAETQRRRGRAPRGRVD